MAKIIKHSATLIFASAVGFIVNLSLLFAFTEYLKIFYIISAILSFIIATTVAFFINKSIAFNKHKSSVKEYSKFFIVCAFSLIINIAILYLATQYLGIYYIFSQIIASGVSLILNTLINLTWTFKKYS
jgi:dolichol-phosphate mannosyltransferase